MGKNDKTGLGRALVKKHNQMVQLAKEKGKLQRKKVLESITEVTDIETVIENAEEAELLFDADHPFPNLPIDLLEENDKIVLTPFEKNLDIWRQLWRVIERSDLLVTVVGARDPMFYRCPDLEAYVKEVEEHKRTLLLMNKADLLPYDVRHVFSRSV